MGRGRRSGSPSGRAWALAAGCLALGAAALGEPPAAGPADFPPRWIGAQERPTGGGQERIHPPERIEGQVVDEAGNAAEAQTLVRLREAAERSGAPRDWYNYGTALLRGGRWEEAGEHLRRAASAEEPEVRVPALYNNGLARAEAARRSGAGSEGRREGLREAREAFRAVLRRRPRAEDARWNLELVERWLEEEPRPGGSGASGEGPSPDGGGDAGSASSGDEGASERWILAPEEAEALLGAAGEAERSARERLLQRARLRDPIVLRNW